MTNGLGSFSPFTSTLRSGPLVTAPFTYTECRAQLSIRAARYFQCGGKGADCRQKVNHHSWRVQLAAL